MRDGMPWDVRCGAGDGQWDGSGSRLRVWIGPGPGGQKRSGRHGGWACRVGSVEGPAQARAVGWVVHAVGLGGQQWGSVWGRAGESAVGGGFSTRAG